MTQFEKTQKVQNQVSPVVIFNVLSRNSCLSAPTLTQIKAGYEIDLVSSSARIGPHDVDAILPLCHLRVPCTVLGADKSLILAPRISTVFTSIEIDLVVPSAQIFPGDKELPFLSNYVGIK